MVRAGVKREKMRSCPNFEKQQKAAEKMAAASCGTFPRDCFMSSAVHDELVMDPGWQLREAANKRQPEYDLGRKK